MIGQTELINTVYNQIDAKSFPRFSIFVGPRGSGKKTLCRNIYQYGFSDRILYWLPDNKVDTIRDMIEDANKFNNRLYILPDADLMSLVAKNAILKVIEECPNNSYIIMTLEDVANTLPTIKSRGVIYTMEPYTHNQLVEYAKSFQLNIADNNTLADICSTPGDMQLFMSTCGSIQEFYSYTKLVFDNISKVSGANAFKIANKLAIKDNIGYDIKLFWSMFIRVCFEQPKNNIYMNWVRITSQSIQDLRIRGLNKQMLVDNWILRIREAAFNEQ